ncbi:MAG: transposase zinc-binding domain-containing protein [Promethearchaeota archaeon]
MGFLFLWSLGLETLLFRCFVILLGYIKLTEIFLKNNSWEQFKEKYKDELREVEIQGVEKIFSCRDPKNGYKTFKCPKCGFNKRLCFSCKSRLCSRCGKTHMDHWTRQVERKLLKVTHRYMVFTISDQLWPFLKQYRFLHATLFKAVKRTIDRLVHDRYSPETIKVGLIYALYTGGKDLKFNKIR